LREKIKEKKEQKGTRRREAWEKGDEREEEGRRTERKTMRMERGENGRAESNEYTTRDPLHHRVFKWWGCFCHPLPNVGTQPLTSNLIYLQHMSDSARTNSFQANKGRIFPCLQCYGSVTFELPVTRSVIICTDPVPTYDPYV
jgi:hypothetical protein